MKYLIFMFLISISFGCKGQTKEFDSELKLADTNYVVLDYKSDWNWIFKAAIPTNISKKELAEVEEIIQKAIAENNEKQRKILERYNKKHPDNQRTETGFELDTKGFKRQYVPVINQNGEKEVWINFSCDGWGSKYWKLELMEMADGGNCYFNLKVNLETGTYSDLRINGYV